MNSFRLSLRFVWGAATCIFSMPFIAGCATATDAPSSEEAISSEQALSEQCSVTTAPPAATSWGSGRLDVFAAGFGLDGYKLHHLWKDGGGWSNWEPLGGYRVTGNAPAAASWGPGRIDVFSAISGSRNVGHWFFDAGHWTVEFIEGASEYGPDRIAVASWGWGRLDLIAKVKAKWVHKSYDANGGGWSGWQPTPVPDNATNLTVASSQVGRVDLYYTVNDTFTHSLYRNGQWSSNDTTPGTPGQYLAASKYKPSLGGNAIVGLIDDPVQGPCGYLGDRLASPFGVGEWHKKAWMGAWSSPPALTSPSDGQVDVFIYSDINTLWHRYMDANGQWSQFTEKLGAPPHL